MGAKLPSLLIMPHRANTSGIPSYPEEMLWSHVVAVAQAAAAKTPSDSLAASTAMRGLITPDERRRTISILKALELPLWHPSLNRDVVAYALRDAASLRSGYQRIPLMTGIGEASFFSDIQVDEVVKAVESARIEHASLYGDASATLEGYNWPGEPVQSSQRRDVQAARVRKLPEHLRN